MGKQSWNKRQRIHTLRAQARANRARTSIQPRTSVQSGQGAPIPAPVKRVAEVRGTEAAKAQLRLHKRSRKGVRP